MDTIQTLKYVVYGTEAMAALAGFIYWHTLKPSYWKWFPVYLLIIAIGEISNEWLITHCQGVGITRFMGEIYFPFILIPAEFLFFTWLYSRYFKTKTGQWLCAISVFLVLSGLLADLLYFSKTGPYWFWSFSYCIGVIALLMLVIYFIISFTAGDAVLYWKTERMMWVSLGLILFFAGSVGFFGLLDDFLKNNNGRLNTYLIITLLLNALMYILFSISFIWGRQKK